MKFSDYLARLTDIELGKKLPKGYIAETYFFAFSGAEIAGRISIHHSLNDFLFRIGGHIGYGVLENSVEQELGKPLKRRYWIQT